MNQLARKSKNVVRINLARCKACGICEYVCPPDAIEPDEYSYPVLDVDKCTGCQACILACPDFCITLVEREA